jgi:hypothetical protein
VAARKQKQRRMSAQVVEDEDYQLRYEVVAGIDVAKESAAVCVRLPPAAGKKHRTSHLQTVPATVPAITELAAELKAAGVQMVSMEATSDYWRIWLRREASCCIPGLAGRNLEDIPGSDGLLKIRKVKGTIACQETSGRADAYGRGAGKTRVIWLKLNCLNPNLQKG